MQTNTNARRGTLRWVRVLQIIDANYCGGVVVLTLNPYYGFPSYYSTTGLRTPDYLNGGVVVLTLTVVLTLKPSFETSLSGIDIIDLCESLLVRFLLGAMLHQGIAGL